jgi:hypothetical protein
MLLKTNYTSRIKVAGVKTGYFFQACSFPSFGLQSFDNALISFEVKRAWFVRIFNRNSDKSRLLIIGSQVRALVRPPSFSST